MPAFLTHYTCGLRALTSLPSEGTIARAIQSHPGVYHVGLAGPDLFFYSLEAYLHKGMTIGRIMHKYRTGRFLRGLFEGAMRLHGEERSCALAYVAGFVGHYCLDSAAHYLVYRTCFMPDLKESLGKHFRYEAAMDVWCCEQLLKRPIGDAGLMQLIKTSEKEKRVISRLLFETIRGVYPDLKHTPTMRSLRLTMHEYVWITRLLIDPSGFKEWVYCAAEKRILGFAWLSPLFINFRKYGLTERDWQRFQKRFDRGERKLRQLLTLMERACEAEVHSNDDLRFGGADDGRMDAAEGRAAAGCRDTFYKALGSRSYHGFYHEEANSDLPLAELEEIMLRRERERKVLPETDP